LFTQTEIKNNLNTGIPIVLQIAKLIPQWILNEVVEETDSDAYYKTLTIQKQLVCLLYGVITKCNSFNVLCKNLQFLENKVTSIGIEDLPRRSTLGDTNVKRSSSPFTGIYTSVFELLYTHLHKHYATLLNNETYSFISDIDGSKQIEIIASRTISLFSEIFRGAGRNCLIGAKKGGLKIHAKLPLGRVTPNMVHITEAACNDKNFLGQLATQFNIIYVFDKGYVNYLKWLEMDETGAYWVTRLNKNAQYDILSQKVYDCIEYADGEIIIILVKKNYQGIWMNTILDTIEGIIWGQYSIYYWFDL
jgi:hypothetical protein